jgi:hypothetical protein
MGIGATKIDHMGQAGQAHIIDIAATPLHEPFGARTGYWLTDIALGLLDRL